MLVVPPPGCLRQCQRRSQKFLLLLAMAMELKVAFVSGACVLFQGTSTGKPRVARTKKVKTLTQQVAAKISAVSSKNSEILAWEARVQDSSLCLALQVQDLIDQNKVCKPQEGVGGGACAEAQGDL